MSDAMKGIALLLASPFIMYERHMTPSTAGLIEREYMG